MAKKSIKSENVAPFGGIFHVRELFPRFVGRIADLRAVVGGHLRFNTCIGIECQSALCQHSHGETGTNKKSEYLLHNVDGVFRVDALVSAKTSLMRQQIPIYLSFHAKLILFSMNPLGGTHICFWQIIFLKFFYHSN